MRKVIEMVSYEDIPSYTGLENTTSIEIKEGYEWDGHGYGICVGIIKEDGTVESCFKSDINNGNTDIFDKLRKDIHLIEKDFSYIDRSSDELFYMKKYYVPYKVKDHCSNKPTVTDSYVDNCCNVHYSVEYEILLVADEGYKRYITNEYKTKGYGSSCFFDQVKDIEEIFEEWFEEGSHGFKIDDNNNKSVTFYDDTGEKCDIDVVSVAELLSMIASIRVIKCDREIID